MPASIPQIVHCSTSTTTTRAQVRTSRNAAGCSRWLPAEAEPVGNGGGLAAVGHAELGQDAGDVDRGGLGADEQRFGDLPVGTAVGEEREHVPLAPGETE